MDFRIEKMFALYILFKFTLRLPAMQHMRDNIEYALASNAMCLEASWIDFVDFPEKYHRYGA